MWVLEQQLEFTVKQKLPEAHQSLLPPTFPLMWSSIQTRVDTCSAILENSIDILASALLSDWKWTVWEDLF